MFKIWLWVIAVGKKIPIKARVSFHRVFIAVVALIGDGRRMCITKTAFSVLLPNSIVDFFVVELHVVRIGQRGSI